MDDFTIIEHPDVMKQIKRYMRIVHLINGLPPTRFELKSIIRIQKFIKRKHKYQFTWIQFYQQLQENERLRREREQLSALWRRVNRLEKRRQL